MAYDYKKSFMDMLGAMYDPIIVFPGWGEQVADWLRQEIELQRMTQVMEAAKKNERPDKATDAEALAYLYPATHIAPLPSDIVGVYLWLGKKVSGKRYPKGLDKVVPKELNPDQRRFLDDLKAWLWTKRIEARGRRRA